jgi:putative transposase
MKQLTLRKREVKYLNKFVRTGYESARALTRARVLLLANDGKKDVEIQEVLRAGRSTVWRVKQNYLRHGLAAALTEKPRPGQPLKYNEKSKAGIIAYACTAPPAGRKRWTVRLLAEELRTKKGFRTINRETVRLVLKKTAPNLG